MEPQQYKPRVVKYILYSEDIYRFDPCASSFGEHRNTGHRSIRLSVCPSGIVLFGFALWPWIYNICAKWRILEICFFLNQMQCIKYNLSLKNISVFCRPEPKTITQPPESYPLNLVSIGIDGLATSIMKEIRVS